MHGLWHLLKRTFADLVAGSRLCTHSRTRRYDEPDSVYFVCLDCGVEV